MILQSWRAPCLWNRFVVADYLNSACLIGSRLHACWLNQWFKAKKGIFVADHSSQQQNETSTGTRVLSSQFFTPKTLTPLTIDQ